MKTKARPKAKRGETPRRTEVADEKRLLTPQQAADMLAVDVRTIRRWRSMGTIKGVKLGRLVRFRLEEVERLLKAGTDRG